MKSNRIVLGILAHVDAGKTTLSEGILYKTGTIRKAGRVDSGDAFLDTFALEKKRGITIFSKQAEFMYGGRNYTLLDTPGHVDFSPEMERTLQVLDAAVLVISAPVGINAQVRTLWKLLSHYQVPVFLFVNKMDQPGMDRKHVLDGIVKEFGDGCVDFSEDIDSDPIQEQIAMTDEAVLECYLGGERIDRDAIASLIGQRKLFPVYFGAALRLEGIEPLLDGLSDYLTEREYPETFGARVFKISRDPQGNRLTWIRVTGGTLRVKEVIGEDDKVDQIRIYSGNSYELKKEVRCGEVCALTGLSKTKPGMGLGSEKTNTWRLLAPVLRSTVTARDGADPQKVQRAVTTLGEEEPMLQVQNDEETGSVSIGIMGEVQTEILHQVILDRFGIDVAFGPGKIQYKETIAEPVEGVGHFEPLRHYAEVHLLMEPGEPGSGIITASRCSTDVLSENWQRLILSHLAEKKFRGVLTGSEITDMRITLIGGRAHEKHTEGGDFRQATYRAVRQGLMMATMRLLEPVCSFRMRIPQDQIGRALNDLTRMSAEFDPPMVTGQEAEITGKVPASEIGDYQITLTSYTGGQGQIQTALLGYFPCHDADRVIAEAAYEPERDTANPSSSVFCSHGAGVLIPWDQVRNVMHVDTGWRPGLRLADGGWVEDGTRIHSDFDLEKSGDRVLSAGTVMAKRKEKAEAQMTFKEREKLRGAAEQELKEIFERTYGTVRDRNGNASGTLDRHMNEDALYDQSWRDYKNRGESDIELKKRSGKNGKRAASRKQKRYFLVDGYNIIFAWEDLRALAAKNIDSARDALTDRMSEFQGASPDLTVILVYDAYKVRGRGRSIVKTGGIIVVYTKEAETADAYIEKTVHEIASENQVFVATSDGLEQTIILGEGATRISARELLAMTEQARNDVRARSDEAGSGGKALTRLMDHADDEVKAALQEGKTVQTKQ
jgi:ribosomal protection tetracycline resistance protein